VGESALRGQVTMILRRRRTPLLQQAPVSTQLRRYPYDVIVSRHENEGFGFVIISSSNHYYGSTIGMSIIQSFLHIYLTYLPFQENLYRAVRRIAVES